MRLRQGPGIDATNMQNIPAGLGTEPHHNNAPACDSAHALSGWPPQPFVSPELAANYCWRHISQGFEPCSLRAMPSVGETESNRYLVTMPGLEPGTPRLKVACATRCATWSKWGQQQTSSRASAAFLFRLVSSLKVSRSPKLVSLDNAGLCTIVVTQKLSVLWDEARLKYTSSLTSLLRRNVFNGRLFVGKHLVDQLLNFRMLDLLRNFNISQHSLRLAHGQLTIIYSA